MARSATRRRAKPFFHTYWNKQAELPPGRSVPKTSSELKTYQDEIRDKIRSLLRYQKSDQPLDVRQTVTTPRKGYRIDKLQFLSEPGIYIPTWVYVPENKTGVLPTILYVNDEGMEADGMEFAGEEGSGADAGHARGAGSCGEPGCGSRRPWNRRNPALSFQHSAAYEFGQLFDLETTHVLHGMVYGSVAAGYARAGCCASVDYVLSRDDVDGNHLHVIGKGMGGMWCLYAAALDSRIRSP